MAHACADALWGVECRIRCDLFDAAQLPIVGSEFEQRLQQGGQAAYCTRPCARSMSSKARRRVRLAAACWEPSARHSTSVDRVIRTGLQPAAARLPMERAAGECSGVHPSGLVSVHACVCGEHHTVHACMTCKRTPCVAMHCRMRWSAPVARVACRLWRACGWA